MTLAVARLEVGFQLVVQELGSRFISVSIKFADANPDFSDLLCLPEKLNLDALFFGSLSEYNST